MALPTPPADPIMSLPSSSSDRFAAYRQVVREQSLDAIALVPGANFHRLFGVGFHQNERPLMVLIPIDEQPVAVVPNLELASFSLLEFDGKIIDWRDQSGYQSAFNSMFEHTPVVNIGVEGQVMRVFIHHAMLAAQPGLNIVDAQRAISALRLCKTELEIVSLRKAVAVSERALEFTINAVQVGMSEKDIEGVLLQRLFAEGADELSFDPIVAAGDNSARPHASARADYKVKAGDALLFDFGARMDGLCADITRTFFVQHCSDRQREIYNTVLSANQLGHAVSVAGTSAHKVDDAVTSLLEASPFANRIRHKTGHGLGRDIHEDPYIMRGNNQLLVPGMVFTIEPGLYQIGDFGVRIEDDVLVTKHGVESLTTFDKSLRFIG